MYKLLIVEDEPLARQGLRITIPWDKLDIEIVGEARNGLEGFQMATNLKPDIIITDVRMPIKSGIEMIKDLRSCGINSEIVILSGFGEFESAKIAMDNDVISYLLKPVSNEELLDCISKIIERIKNKNKASMAKEILDNSIEDLRRKIVRVLVRNEFDSLEDLKKEMVFHSFDFVEHGYFLIGVLDDTSSEETPKELFIFENFLDKTMSKHSIKHLGAIYHDKVSFLIEEMPLKQLEEITYEALNQYALKHDATFSIGISSLFENVNEIHKSYEEAKGVALNGLMKFMNSVQFFNESSSFYPPNLIRALNIIHKEYQSDINVGYVSERLNVSESYLMHLFKEKLGITFNKVLTDTRIRNAKIQLLSGKYRINEVAFNVGFNSEKYFTMIFKKVVGITPSEFIKKSETKSKSVI